MALDKRQTDIKEGAGLEESKLNQEFIDFLKKYLTPALAVIAAISLAYVGWDRFKKYREGQVDKAWEGFEAASASRNPDGLLAVASENSSEPGVPLLARAEAADLLLQSAISGLAPGAEVDPEGKVKNPDDLLTPERRTEQYKRAGEEYQKVVDAAGTRSELVLHRLRGLFGLAAVDESQGKFDVAKERYQQIMQVAKEADLPGLEGAAKKLLETLDEAKTGPRVVSDAQVVTKPPPPPPPPQPPTGFTPGVVPGAPQIITPGSGPVNIVPVAPPSAPATPAPTPASPESPKPAQDQTPGG